MSGRVMRVLAGRGCRPEEAEDIAQEVLWRVWQRRDAVRDLWPYILTVMRKRLARLAAQRKALSLELLMERGEEPWADELPEDDGRARELADYLSCAAPQDQLLGWLYWVVTPEGKGTGVTSEAIGALLGMTGGQVRMRALRLKQRLLSVGGYRYAVV